MRSRAVDAPVSLPAAPVEPAVDSIAASVQPAVDLLTAMLDVTGRAVTVVCREPVGGAVVAPVDSVARAVQPPFDPVAAIIEPAFDTIALAVCAALDAVAPVRTLRCFVCASEVQGSESCNAYSDCCCKCISVHGVLPGAVTSDSEGDNAPGAGIVDAAAAGPVMPGPRRSGGRAQI